MLNLKKIPRTELQVMKFIWAQESCRVASVDITKFMSEEYDWSKGTTSKTLSRLVEKEFLEQEKEGRQTFYSPLISSEEYLKFETQDFFSFMHNNSLTSIMSALDDSKDISEGDIKDLEEWIKNR
ncbi:TPA: BlaI/MecI/CopY family transcriptional regulator [Clostridium botulinum]|uniref:BlaI/MecI/CopY family transcriptional regulator n=1 Tax=Clostridium botulinum TaxID=1491 RepID=UPI001F2442A6|nr:BlaI/MecI/CopY family transcriptional regulator [Clostridium botulinum]MCS4458800.1 BlaI/MecI/CopY family transcriptional regulator [Clostridium botulinum]MCS4460248.1 BlaI/MecI/CopY family transcriptional regulator [Clostridium botulinum]MCS4513884.1 BlaI/MecI/CopY family transcriptional regulator [Clostridium botulinum]MCS4519015.1 BlaI/MecI/CopY family transcriptional regulator [Clostridium botulinum]UUN84759.1 BlaI/MecI/CopY family transcriptional regulator [Clostridium botulinum]